MNNPNLSIIIPIYKAETCLCKCINSILSQTYRDFELLLIDDGSPDNSGMLCDEYARKDSRIRVFHKRNGGVSSARNLGIDKSLGKYLIFVDADDWCEPTYVANFFIGFDDVKNVDTFILQGRINDDYIENSSNPVRLKELYYSKERILTCIKDNYLLAFGAPYCKLFSRDIITKHNIRFPIEYSYGEDTTFFLQYLYYVDDIITKSSCGYHYITMKSSSLSKKYHDFKPLYTFIKDSLFWVSKIEKKYSGRNGNIMSAYCSSCTFLLMRAVLNMYRLKYTFPDRLFYMNQMQEDLLLKMKFYGVLSNNSKQILSFLSLPSRFIDVIVRILYFFRK